MRVTRLICSQLVFIAACSVVLTAQSLTFQDRGNRLEGYQRQEIAAPAFEALAFVRGARLGSLRSPLVLQLHFFVPKASRVNIRAIELVPVKQYQMRAKRVDWAQGWNNFGPWATADVIDALGVPLGNIGVLAQGEAGKPGIDELVPVSFTARDLTSADYEFQFRVKYDVESASYRVERVGTSGIVRSGAIHKIPGENPASLHFDLTGAPSGEYQLTLDCLYENRAGGPQRVFTFYHATRTPGLKVN